MIEHCNDLLALVARPEHQDKALMLCDEIDSEIDDGVAESKMLSPKRFVETHCDSLAYRGNG
jgi:hypothetical protein